MRKCFGLGKPRSGVGAGGVILTAGAAVMAGASHRLGSFWPRAGFLPKATRTVLLVLLTAYEFTTVRKNPETRRS